MPRDGYVMTPIVDGLFLCGVFALGKNLGKNKITHVINCTDDPDKVKLEGGFVHIPYPAEDDEDFPLGRYFDDAADKVNEIITNDGRVVIHCMAGVSRSASLVIAYLIKHKNMSLREAFLMVREKRRIAMPNHGFMRQLMVFEKRVRGTTSIEMVDEGQLVPDIYIELGLFKRLHPELLKEMIETFRIDDDDPPGPPPPPSSSTSGGQA